MAEEKKSKILIVGGTGYIGRFIVAASARLGHPTFVLVRKSSLSDPDKVQLLQGFNNSGVTLLQGDLYDHGSMVKAMKQVDMVISALGFRQANDEPKILDAIKDAGNIKKFYPSEYGNDVDHGNPVGPTKHLMEIRFKFRRAIEVSGVPYTFVSSNCFAGSFLRNLAQAEAAGLPRDSSDKVTIFGDGSVKAVFVAEEDIGTYTVRSLDDPRTTNKILYMRPPANTLTQNELVSLWEKKTGKTFQRVHIPPEDVLKQIEVSPMPLNLILAIRYAIFVNGDQTNFKIEPSFGVDTTELYPDVKYITVDEYLDRFI